MRPILRQPALLASGACIALFAIAAPVAADLTLTLPNDFIEKYKNRATIATEFEIHFAHKAPKKPSPSKPANDGDIHISGIASELRMPAVAELMNAAGQPKSARLRKQDEGRKGSAHGGLAFLAGAWRGR